MNEHSEALPLRGRSKVTSQPERHRRRADFNFTFAAGRTAPNTRGSSGLDGNVHGPTAPASINVDFNGDGVQGHRVDHRQGRRPERRAQGRLRPDQRSGLLARYHGGRSISVNAGNSARAATSFYGTITSRRNVDVTASPASAADERHVEHRALDRCTSTALTGFTGQESRPVTATFGSDIPTSASH